MQRKSGATIQQQYKAASSAAPDILPSGSDLSALTNCSAKELRDAHPARWAAYVELVRRDRGAQVKDAPSIKQLEKINRLRSFIEAEQLAVSPTLREAQVAVFKDILHHLEMGETRGYIKCPTGFGKTVMFSKLVEALGTESAVVVPKRLLAGQTIEKFEKFAPGVEISQVYGGKKGELSNCTVTTYQYLNRAGFDGRFNLKSPELYVLDELHKWIGPSGQSLLATIPQETIVLGFTATPKYSDEHSVEKALGSCFHEISVQEAIKIGALAPVMTMVVKSKVDVSTVPLKGNGEYDVEALTTVLEKQGVAQGAVKMYKEAFDGESGVCFCGTIKYSESVAKRFNDANIPAAAISGKTPPDELKRIFEAYHRGDIKILCSADLLIEGFDAPRASVCFNLVETSSMVSAEQQGGRVERLDENDIFKIAKIIDFHYSDGRRRTPPVFYHDILGGTACPGISERSDEISRSMASITAKLETLDILGLEVVLETQKILEIKKALEPNKLPEAPPDWLPIDKVAQLTKLSISAIRQITQENSEDFKGLTGRFIPPEGGRAAIFFSPDTVELIAETKESNPKLRGWMTATKLHQIHQLPLSAVERALEQFQDLPNNEDKWEVGRVGNSRTTYYHPTVSQFLLQKFPNQHWVSHRSTELSQERRIPKELVEKLYQEIQGDFPELAASITKGGVMKASPEIFVEVLKRANLWFGRSEKGLISIGTLARELDLPIERCIAALRKEAPVIAERYRNKIGVRSHQMATYDLNVPGADLLPVIIERARETGMTVQDITTRIIALRGTSDQRKVLLADLAQKIKEGVKSPAYSETYDLLHEEEMAIRTVLTPTTMAPNGWISVSEIHNIHPPIRLSDGGRNSIGYSKEGYQISKRLIETLPPWLLCNFKNANETAALFAHPEMKRVLELFTDELTP